MSTFEGHEGKMTSEPSSQPFASRHSASPISTNAPLPPGHPSAPDYTKRTPSKTKRSFIKKIGD